MYKTKFALPAVPLLLGVLTLAGWSLDINLLQRGITSSVPMNPLTAVGFILLGIETLRWHTGINKLLPAKAGQLIVGVVIVAAILKLSDVYLNTSFAIDQLLFTEKLEQNELYPSRIAPNSALCFLLLGCAMQLVRSQSNKAILTAQLLTLTAATLAFIAMVGYLYGVSRFNGYAALIPMAFNTSIAFIFIAIAILFIHPSRGFMHVLTSEGPARKVATILLPATIVIPFLLSWIGLKTQQAGIHDIRFDASMTVVLDVVIFLALSYISIRSLFFADKQRQQILAELRQNEHRYRLLVDGVKDVANLMLDRHGHVVTWNQGAERLKGYTAAEIIGRHFSVFYPPDAIAAGKTETELAEAREQGRTEDEGWRIRKDGSMFWAHVVITTLYGENGEIQGFSKITRDISQRKQIEKNLLDAKEQAEKASAAKDAFLATMSHEIRTPLTGMLGMLELLSMTHLDDKQAKTLHTARQSGRNLLRIVSDILDWSKIEEGKLELSLQSTSIPQVLKEVVDTYSGVASSKNLTLWQNADSHLSPAHIVDPLRLSQILHNFVSNAIKFTPPEGGIELRAELLEQVESGEKIRFSVKDTGIGIPKNVQTKLFERYRQEHVDTARMYGGTGLGLAICRRLADLMDGQIELVSEPGQGATFSITLILPVSGAPGVATHKQYLEVEQRAVKPLFTSSTDAPLVLAVDDHPINCDLLMNQISVLGLRVDTASNGQVALAMWQEKHYALVITDCHMPEMDGYTFTQEVRKLEVAEKRKHTPIIAWTANALADESHRCEVAGMDDLLVKPASIIQLKNTLAKWLSIPVDNDQTLSPPAESHLKNVPIDFTVLEQSVPDTTAQVKVLHNFKTHVHAGYADLLAHLGQGNLPDLKNASHRMKGSCQMVGAKDIASACAIIELAAHNEDMVSMHEGKAALDDAIGQFDSYMLTLEQPGQASLEKNGG